MSREIDERIVSMEFDNSRFENNVQTSLNTLDKLNNSLKLTEATKGFENVDSAARHIDLSFLSGAVGTVTSRFSAMEVMAITALSNITNSAVNAGKRIAASLTIEPIRTGFAEYETQIGAVQTILANTQSKGSTLDDVNAALDELNTYADKTIYNFTEMTRNIGTFTAAGVDLDKSVTSIKGIANLAAISGSTSQQASTAMYQLSQALAAGKVQLMDWNSVVNAGMGGEVFQTALKRTAKQMGHNVDALIKKYGSFRESLTKGNWLTAEVLTETLTQLSGAYTEADLLAKGYSKEQAKEILELAKTAESAATDVKTFTQLMDTLKESAQSGWTSTWEIIIGDFEESKALWSGVSKTIGDMIGKSAEARNKLLSGALDSNWEKLTKKIEEAGIEASTFEEKVKKVAKAHNVDIDAAIKKHGSLEEAFTSGAISSDILKEAVDGLSSSLSDLSNIRKKLKKGSTGEDVKKVQEALKGLGYDLGKWDIDGVLGDKTEAAIKEFQKANGLKVDGIIGDDTLAALEKASKSASGLSESVGGLIDGITELGGRELIIESIKNVFNTLKKVVDLVKLAFQTVFPPMTSEQLYRFIEGFKNLTDKFKLSAEQTEALYVTFKGFFSVIDIGLSFIKALAGGIWSLLGNLSGAGDGILSFVSSIGSYFISLRESVNETDIFTVAVGKVTNVLQAIIDTIRSAISNIQEKFKMPGFEEFLNVLSKIWDFIKGVGSKIADVFKGIGGALTNAFTGGDLHSFLDVINTGLLASILGKIKAFVGDVTSNPFEDIFEGITTALDSVKGAFEGWQRSLNADVLKKLAISIGIIAVALLLLASIEPEKLSSAIIALGGIMSELAFTMKAIDKLNLKSAAGAAFSMIEVSVAVLILSSAIKNISSLSWEELARGLVGILGLMTIVVGSMKILGSNKKTTIKGARGMIQLATAIMTLSVACGKFAELSWEEIAKGLIGVGILLAELSLFVNNTKFKGKAGATSTGVLILSAAMVVLSKACENFAKMSWENLGKSLVGIGVLLAELAIFMRLLGDNKRMVSIGVALLLIGASMKLFASSVSAFGDMTPEKLEKGLIAIGGLLIGLSQFSKIAGSVKKIMSTAIAMSIIGASMLIFASAVDDFGSMSWETIGKGLAGIGGLLAEIAIFTNLTGDAKRVISTGVALVLIGAAMKIFASAIEDLSTMSLEQIGKGLLGIGGALAAVTIAMNFMPKNLISSGVGLVVIAGAMVILSDALGKFGNMSWDQIARGLVGLGGSIVILGVALRAMSGTFKGAMALIVAADALAILALSIGIIGSLGVTGICVALIGLAGAFAIIGVAGMLLGPLVPVLMQLSGVFITIGLGALVLGAGIFAAGAGIANLAVGIALLAADVPAHIGGIILSLKLILDAVIGLIPHLAVAIGRGLIEILKVLADMGAPLGKALIEILKMLLNVLVECVPDLVTGALKIITGVLSGLAKYAPQIIESLFELLIGLMRGLSASLPEFVTAGLELFSAIFSGIIDGLGGVLTGIGQGLGAVIGGIVDGLLSGISDSLSQMGTDLSTFMTNMGPFLDGASKIDKTTLDSVVALVGIVTELTKAGLIEAITSFIGGDSALTKFAEDIVPFGTAIQQFSNEIAGINESGVTAAANAGSIIAGMIDTIPKSGGVVGFFTGEHDLATFAANIVPFGTAIKQFADEVAGIDESGVTAAANAGATVASMAETIPTSGGVFQFFTGEHDIGKFAEQIVPFGTAIKKFADEVVGIDEGAVTAAANAGSALAVMSQNLPESGGLWQWFSGDKNMETFGNQLEGFGKGVKKLSDSVVGIDTVAITAAADVGTTMNTLGGTVLADNPANIKSLGSAMESFGQRIKKFHTNVTDVDTEKLNASVAIGTTMNTLGGSVTADNVENIKSLGNAVADFGPDMKKFSTNVTSVDTDKLKTAVSQVRSLVYLVSGRTKADFEGLDAFGKSLKGIGKDGVDNFVKAFTDANDRLLKAGGEMLANLKKGATDKASELAKAFTTMASDAVTAIRDKYDSFKSAGKYVVEGFAKGIDVNTYKATAEAKAMAKAAAKAAEEALGVKSPSRVFYGIGNYAGIGFTNALNDNERTSYKAGYGMAESAKFGLSKALHRIRDIVENGIDTQPTIRPVLDLSNVSAGAGAINGMLDMSPSVGVMSNIRSISSMMNSNQNGVNYDVVSAIEDLGRKIGSLRGDSYSINGITYDDGSNVSEAVRTLVRAARVERRI